MLTTNFTKLKDYEQIKEWLVFHVFMRHMEGKAIGGEALEDAWFYFLEGWKAYQDMFGD